LKHDLSLLLSDVGDCWKERRVFGELFIWWRLDISIAWSYICLYGVGIVIGYIFVWRDISYIPDIA
jgi:hypothetical protein